MRKYVCKCGHYLKDHHNISSRAVFFTSGRNHADCKIDTCYCQEWNRDKKE